MIYQAERFGHKSIPFGISIDTGDFVEIGNAKRGRNCQCICPSCEQPLQACHGNVNDWHFKHDTKGVDENDRPICDFSIWPTLRKFAAQTALSQGLTQLKTPALSRSLKGYTQEVTTSNLCNVRYVKSEDWTDLTATFPENKASSRVIRIFFTYPGRDGETESEGGKNGLLEVSLLGVFSFLKSKTLHKDIFANAVCQLLAETIDWKVWVYHPRQNEIMARLEAIAQTSNGDGRGERALFTDDFGLKRKGLLKENQVSHGSGASDWNGISFVTPSSSAITTRTFYGHAINRLGGSSSAVYTAFVLPGLSSEYSILHLSYLSGTIEVHQISGQLFQSRPRFDVFSLQQLSERLNGQEAGLTFFQLEVGVFNCENLAEYIYKAAVGELGVQVSAVAFQACHEGAEGCFRREKARAIFGSDLCGGLTAVGASSRIVMPNYK